ncbi:MAG TPA: fumarylacetoacetate hydrolase family protein [Candidatus Dormibacteraeota bacterium]|nr:fumarylacetoacetate hydrolase family protein [Candidatus Dormibacteraeota bacterium]
MRLLTFRAQGGGRLGVLRSGADNEVIELTEPKDMLSLIDAGDEGLAHVRSALALPKAKVHSLETLELLAPLDNPRGNVVAIGRNYQKHAEETALVEGRQPNPPTIFSKAITSLTEPFADIAIDPAISEMIDWEVELAVVIGKRGANIKRGRALDHVFGYTVINDVTARDIQNGWGGQYFKGKSLDRTAPSGPWIVTKDEIDDPQKLNLVLRLNDTVKQDGNTRDMIYPVDAIIEWVTKGMTLLPGAIIATGTPDGVGYGRTPAEYMKPGDVMESEVERIGAIRNRIVSTVGD